MIQRLARHPHSWLALLVAYTLWLTFLSLNPWVRPNPQPDDLIPEDKVGHFIGYLWLSLLMGAAFWQRLRQLPRVWSGPVFVAAAATLYGAFIELAQHTLTDYRSGEWGDVLANGIGAAAGGIVLLALLYRTRPQARPPVREAR